MRISVSTCIIDRSLSCTLNSASGLIQAECSHSDSSIAAGIQVIVQSTNVSEVHKLYVNQSMDLHTPVTVPVERDGEYQVSIFAIREGIGILGSGVGYTEHVTVNTPAMAIESTTVDHVSTAPGILIPKIKYIPKVLFFL